jgi:hypothetical protein
LVLRDGLRWIQLLDISDPDVAIEFRPDQLEQLRRRLHLVPGDIEGPGIDV